MAVATGVRKGVTQRVSKTAGLAGVKRKEAAAVPCWLFDSSKEAKGLPCCCGAIAPKLIRGRRRRRVNVSRRGRWRRIVGVRRTGSKLDFSKVALEHRLIIGVRVRRDDHLPARCGHWAAKGAIRKLPIGDGSEVGV